LLIGVRESRDLYSSDSAQGRQMERTCCTAGTDDSDSQGVAFLESRHTTLKESNSSILPDLGA
jgi:hypothetical protein